MAPGTHYSISSFHIHQRGAPLAVEQAQESAAQKFLAIRQREGRQKRSAEEKQRRQRKQAAEVV
jgi:hypothetical protein